MDQTTHEVRLANWKVIIEQCQARPKGQTAKQWMVENDISDKQYYYWLRRLRAAAIKKNQMPALPELTVHGTITFLRPPQLEVKFLDIKFFNSYESLDPASILSDFY